MSSSSSTELQRHRNALCTPQALRMKHVRPYIPDFKLAFEHFCIHTGAVTPHSVVISRHNALMKPDAMPPPSRISSGDNS